MFYGRAPGLFIPNTNHEARGKNLDVFQPQRVEHALGPGRRVYSNAVTINDFQASTSAGAENAECDAPPTRLRDPSK